MRFVIFGGLSILFLLAGCGRSMPSASDIRDGFKHYGEVIDFKKTNGEMAEFGGMREYAMKFRAAITLREGLCSDSGRIIDCTRLPSHFLPRTVSAGALYILKGEISFRHTENGWKINGWAPLKSFCLYDNGITDCSGQVLLRDQESEAKCLGNITECYRALLGSESND